VIGLAGYRLAHLIVLDAGPGMVFHRLRQWADRSDWPFIAGVTSCMSCATFWAVLIGVGLWSIPGLDGLVWLFAAWGLATLAHKATA
jgi:hypothetical protein